MRFPAGRGRALSRVVCVAALAIAVTAGGTTAQASSGPRPLNSVRSFAAVLKAADDLGPVASHTPLTVDLTLRQNGSAAAQKAAAAAYDPSSPSYGHLLTSRQYDAMLGLKPDQVAAEGSRLAGSGISLKWADGSMGITLTGVASAFNRAFDIRVDSFVDTRGDHFWASRNAPTLPSGLVHIAWPLDRFTDWSPPLNKDAVHAGGVRPQDLESAYGTTGLRNDGIDGSGETVVVYALGDDIQQSDLDEFDKEFGLPSITPTIIGPRGQEQGEAIMDVSAIHAVAPGAKIILYTKPVKTNQDLVDIEQQMVDQNQGAILSQSWGGCEQGMGTELAQFFKQLSEKADSLGESAFFATGDNGGYDCLQPGDYPTQSAVGTSLPATAPGFTAVGGTRLELAADGGYYDEQGWKGLADASGGGGGVSAYFSRPSWQRGQGVNNQYDPDHMREVPDVAALGDPTSGMSLIVQGQQAQIGGTSLATPVWAGFTALIDEYLQKNGQKPVGFMNPALYAIAAGSPPYAAFHDVTEGGNDVYPATAGYDLSTGLGTPDVYNLARDILSYEQNGGHV